MRLARSLSGLKRAGREWKKEAASTLVKNRFEQSPADACVSRQRENGAVRVPVVAHVDDILVIRERIGGTNYVRRRTRISAEESKTSFVVHGDTLLTATETGRQSRFPEQRP